MPSNLSNLPKSETGTNLAQVSTKLQHALALHQQGELSRAEKIYEEILQVQPTQADALHLLGMIAYQNRNGHRALELIDKAIAITPNNAGFYFNRGIVLEELKQLEAALASYDKSIAINTDFAKAYSNRGLVLQELKQLEAALASYDMAIAIKADFADAHNNRGLVLQELKQLEAALASYDMAIAIKADFADAHNNRGLVLQELKEFEAAVASYDKAIMIKGDIAEAYYNRGNVLKELKQYEAALANYDKAIMIKPDYEYLYEARLGTKMFLCDWTNINNEVAELIKKIESNEKTTSSFSILGLKDSLAIQHKAAKLWMKDKHSINHSLGNITKQTRKDKIRIGYYSADFYNHATAYLMAELFELHNKNKFELIAFSFGPDINDEMRKRVSNAFDQFIDIRNQSNKNVAQLSRQMGVDIAVDLKGYTANGRTGIFSYRAAPIQVNYLGYPGTMAADYIDYVIADKTLIPEASQKHYSEKIVYLPNSYQVNDSKRKIAGRVFSRSELGLPDNGFVFCCFNNSYKITPSTFDGWMRILTEVEGSVLWLLVDNPTAAINLRNEAEVRGVNKARLVFAKTLPLPEHLARHRVADLFLDTLPCNAHTTASDALWSGLPVLTCMGESFASRVAASLLNAIHLPELIAKTQEDYETLAIELATNPQKLAAIKQKLSDNRLTTPLFDTLLFVKHIEACYIQMYERYLADLPPDLIYIQP